MSNTSPESLARTKFESSDLTYDVSFDFECDWESAINFRPGQHGRYGYLLIWSGCGGLSLKPDITLANPFGSGVQNEKAFSEDKDGDTVVKCVGVISKFKFRGETKTDPIRISAYVSAKSAAALHSQLSGALLTRSKLKNDLEVSWYIISCDGAGEKWYEAAHVQNFKPASANIATTEGQNDPGGELKIKIDRKSCGPKDSEGKVIDIRLYEFEFEFVPAAGKKTELHFEVAYGQKVVREWGGSE